MANYPGVKPEHVGAALYLIGMPRPKADWPSQANCARQEPPAQPEAPEGYRGRKRTEYQRAFIGQYCGGCAVTRECLVDGVESAPTTSVYGGMLPEDVLAVQLAQRALQDPANAEYPMPESQPLPPLPGPTAA